MKMWRNAETFDRIATLEREGDALRQTLAAHLTRIDDQNAAVRACEAVVAEREAELRDRAATIMERETALATCQGEVAAREATIAACEAVVAEREAALRDRAVTIMERETALATCQAEVAAREATIAACEAVVAKREAEIIRLEATIRQCEQVVRDREATIKAREIVIQGHEQAMEIVRFARLGHQADVAMPAATGTIAVAPAPVPPLFVFHGKPAWDDPGHDMDISDQHHRDRMFEEAGFDVQNTAMTPNDVDRALEDWQAVAAKYADEGLWGGQQLIEPYLVERHIHDRIGHLIMATVESQLWYDNAHGIELPELLRLGMIRRGDTVFDCGANQGLHSVSYARAVGAAGRVVAFDPFALHIDIGRFNARLNKVRNIDFIKAGVSNKAEQLTVSMIEQCVGSPDTTPEAKTISLLTLDSFCSLQPSFIKIDIEGAEVNALEGANELLKTEPSLYIEIHPQYLPRFNRKPMDVFKHVSFEKYRFYIHHPGVPPLSDYDGQFEITDGCALYCVPRSRSGYIRHLGKSKAAALN